MARCRLTVCKQCTTTCAIVQHLSDKATGKRTCSRGCRKLGLSKFADSQYIVVNFMHLNWHSPLGHHANPVLKASAAPTAQHTAQHSTRRWWDHLDTSFANMHIPANMNGLVTVRPGRRRSQAMTVESYISRRMYLGLAMHSQHQISRLQTPCSSQIKAAFCSLMHAI